MNLKPLNEFLDNSLNLRSYELYEVVGELVLRQENHRTQEIQIKYVRNIEALLVEKGMTLFEEELKNQNKNENAILINSTKIKNLSNLSIITNDENISFKENIVYLIKAYEDFFIVDEIFKNYDFSDNDASFITKIDLTNFKKINSNVKFVFTEAKKLEDEIIVENQPTSRHVYSDKITIRFPNSTLINQISVNGELSLYKNGAPLNLTTTKNFILESESNLTTLPLILNPFYLSNNEHNKTLWLSRFHNFLYHINFWNWMPYVLANNKIDIQRQILLDDNTSFNLLLEVVKNSDIQKNNFKGLSDVEITTLKNKYGTLDMSKVNDYLIDVRLKELDKTDILAANRLRNVILALSSYILSSFSIKGGLNEEHKLALPFYFESNGNLIDTKLKSEWFLFEDGTIKPNTKHNDGVLNSNLVFFNNEVIQFPTPPLQLQEVNVSNLPIEFNTSNSANLNYIWYSFFNNESDITKYLLLQQEIKTTEKFENITFHLNLDNAEKFLSEKGIRADYETDWNYIYFYNGLAEVLRQENLQKVYEKWSHLITEENFPKLSAYIKNSESIQQKLNGLNASNITIKSINLNPTTVDSLYQPGYTTLTTKKQNRCKPGTVKPNPSGPYGITCDYEQVDVPVKVVVHPRLIIVADIYYDKFESGGDQVKAKNNLVNNKFVFNDILNAQYIKDSGTEQIIELTFNLNKNNVGYYKATRINNIAITSLFGSWMEIIVGGITKTVLLNNENGITTKIIDYTT